MDHFSEKFICIVIKHVDTIPEDEYKEHTKLSKNGKSLYADNTWRGFACRATRRELIEQAWSINAIRPSDYINVLHNDKTVTVGYIEIEFENEQIKSSVYYFPDRGIYAAACGDNRVYDAWLSWPCYPQGW